MEEDLKKCLIRALRAKANELRERYPTEKDEPLDGRILAVLKAAGDLVAMPYVIHDVRICLDDVETDRKRFVRLIDHYQKLIEGTEIVRTLVEEVGEKYAKERE